MTERRRFAVDGFLEGAALQRDVPLVVDEDRLLYGDRELGLGEVFWTERRAGLLLIFSREFTLALRAAEELLERLQRTISARLNGGERRRERLLEPLGDEEVLCAAATAASGTMNGTAVRGLHVAVFTDHAFHLFARDRHGRIGWPVEEALPGRDPARPDRTYLELRQGDTRVRLLYLSPREVEAVVRVAVRDRTPSEADDGSGEEVALEMFARREVAGPMPARLPDFSTSVESIRQQAGAVAAELAADPSLHTGLERSFFEQHLQELGEIALGPLLARRSAATGSPSLVKAVEAMDAAQLQEDARAAALNTLHRLLEAYDGELGRLLYRKPDASRLTDELGVTAGEREELQGRFLEPVQELSSHLGRLESAQADLLSRLERLETGPPEAEEGEVDRAAREWRTALVRVDLAFDGLWRELLLEIQALWSDRLSPRLGRATAAAPRRAPEWAKLVILAVITTLLVAALVMLLVV